MFEKKEIVKININSIFNVKWNCDIYLFYNYIFYFIFKIRLEINNR